MSKLFLAQLLLPVSSLFFRQWPEPDSTYSLYAPEDLPRLPVFLFIHLEKSAGSELHSAFQAAVEHQLGYHVCGVPIRQVPPEYFVVSSVRNPCEQALSQWSYCCEKAWSLNTFGLWDTSAACGEWILAHGYCPSFSGELTHPSKEKQGPRYTCHTDDPNVDGFREYLLGGCPKPEYEQQFNATFREIGPDRVDCWIRVENLQEDAHRCLREYSKQTGRPVDHKALDDRLLNSNGWDNAGHHEKCDVYFSPTLEQKAIEKNAFLFKYFGYEKCCE
eukprot:CAMPEP_0171095988 /NCGR_PEP_ID=MMETSP0766_2-20121228/43486_1 /TAXON_ID=439317 /ORGANISM="Gambierdiscus australes, Strain CAWD 149" /LENGTH=274 /DNA_ID=CAMNT_0011554869 /DNA_START=47 /DNA_END=871 /DNA_ORIENTATION=+